MRSRGSLSCSIDWSLYREVCFVVKFAMLGRLVYYEVYYEPEL